MSPIIVNQPWPPELGEDLRFPNGQLVICPTSRRAIRVLHDQLIIWATLTAKAQTLPALGAPLFPILIDIGFNDTFLMQQRQAEAWMSPATFATFLPNKNLLNMGKEMLRGWNIALWIYPNVPGTRDPDPSRVPTLIDLPKGVWLTPPGSAYTKEKPLLGLRAIRFNRLLIHIDGAAAHFSLDTP